MRSWVPCGQALLALALFASGCQADDWFGAEKFCGDSRPQPKLYSDSRPQPKVYNGTLLPSYVPLTPQQMPAIGSFRLCSGTLITPTWVITAKHCELTTSAQFCIGYDPEDPSECIQVSRVVDHPDVDMTLIELAEDARARLPGVIPLAVLEDAMGNEWVGRRAEAAGYGQTETGGLGTRYFTAEPIVALANGYVTIDGEGQRGVCFGDSGGPLLVLADDGSVRVAGVLSNGDESCLGRDNFTRTDQRISFIEEHAGPTSSGEQGCGHIGRVGHCDEGRAVWCGNDRIQLDECGAGFACGWDDTAGGFRCISGPDPCEGYDAQGGCDGDVARWCDNGVPRARDCGACGEVCATSVDTLGAYCVTDTCAGLNFLGRCNGNVAEWCEDGKIARRDCSEFGQTCGLVGDDVGYYCVEQ